MKTNRKMFLFALTINAMLLSCSNKTTTQTSDSIESDTLELITEEQVMPDLLTTPDLTLLEVKGNVKEIKGKTYDNYVYGKAAKFDENGMLTHYGNSDPIDKISNIKRDEDGKLTYFLGGEWMTVKWDNDLPLSVANQYNEMTTTETYKYDDKGRITQISQRIQDSIEGEDSTYVGIVSYPEDAYDKNGNWLKRIVKYPNYTETQVREIIYY